MLHKLIAPLTAFTAVFALIIGAAPVHAESFNHTLLAPGAGLYVSGLQHTVEGSRAVLKGNTQDTAGNVYYYDGITLSLVVQQDPPIRVGNVLLDGNYIAWIQEVEDSDPATTPQVYLHDLSTGQTRQVTSGPLQIQAIDMDNGHIVWESNQAIFLYDIASDTVTPLTTYPYNGSAVLADDTVVYHEFQGGNANSSTLYAYRISTGITTQISTAPTPTTQGGVYTRDNQVVWFELTNGFFQIYWYDGSQTVQITSSATNHVTPRISGNTIAWNTIDNVVAIYDIPSATETTLDTVSSNIYIDGDRLIWTKIVGPNGNQADIITRNMTTGETTTLMANSTPFRASMDMSNTMVIWQGLDANRVEGTYLTKFGLPNPEPQTVMLGAMSDTYVRSGQNNQNEGGGQFMKLQSSGDNRALVRFDQNAIQTAIGSGTVLSAKLRLTITDNGNNWGTTGRTIDAHRLLVNWAEGNGTENNRGSGPGATWNCAIDAEIATMAKNCSGATEWEMGQPNNPAVHPWVPAVSATQTITNGQSGVVEFDVTADINSFVNGTTNYGWLLKKTNENQNGMVGFGTKESAAAPQLVITYQP
jgi:hypothetical protein